MKLNRFSPHLTGRSALVGLAGLIIIASGVAVAVALTGRPAPTASPILSPTPSPRAATPSARPTIPAAAPGTAPQQTAAGSPAGTVEGSLRYPADGIPADLRVCAVNLSSQRATCTTQHISDSRFSSGQGYQLALAAGDYQVYAVAPSFDPNYRAYYSKFVTCGYAAGCSDHSPITVTVGAGQTASNIEPGDFYRR